jgi:hypothetical protein
MKAFITISLFLLASYFSYGQIATVKYTYDTDSVYRSHQTILRELRKVGFKVDDVENRSILMTHENGPGNYLYQVVVKRRKKKVIVDAYVFIKGDTRKSWVTWNGVDHLNDLMYAVRERAAGNTVLDMSFFSWNINGNQIEE